MNKVWKVYATHVWDVCVKGHIDDIMCVCTVTSGDTTVLSYMDLPKNVQVCRVYNRTTAMEAELQHVHNMMCAKCTPVYDEWIQTCFTDETQMDMEEYPPYVFSWKRVSD